MSLIYTSGTTGLPKGCMLAHGYYVAGPQALLDCGWIEPGDRIFTTWPLFHSSGQVVALMTALIADGSVVFEPQFSASTFLARAAEEEATVLAGVGFMGIALLAQPPSPADRDHAVRRSFWIPMAPAAQVAFEERFGIPVLTEAFGQTECFPISMAPASGERARHTLGPPTAHYELKLLGDDDTEVPPASPGRDLRPAEDARRHVLRLLEQARGNGRRLAQPVAPHRRHGPARRRRLSCSSTARRTLCAAGGRTCRRSSWRRPF